MDKIDKINNLIINIKDTKETVGELPGYEINNINENIYENNKEQQICWNCCKCLGGNVYSIPQDYVGGIFYTNGNLCSYNCSMRYIIDNYSGSDLWMRVSLLHMYYKINTGHEPQIAPAPHKKLLKVFGGTLSYEEYHKNTNLTIDVFTPPILPINDIEYSHENKKNNKEKNNEYRLYRKTPIKNKNDIYNTMGLSIE